MFSTALIKLLFKENGSTKGKAAEAKFFLLVIIHKHMTHQNIICYVNGRHKYNTPRRKAVPRSLQSSANILVALSASSMLAPEAITAHTIAPADEPANGVVSCSHC